MVEEEAFLCLNQKLTMVEKNQDEHFHGVMPLVYHEYCYYCKTRMANDAMVGQRVLLLCLYRSTGPLQMDVNIKNVLYSYLCPHGPYI